MNAAGVTKNDKTSKHNLENSIFSQATRQSTAIKSSTSLSTLQVTIINNNIKLKLYTQYFCDYSAHTIYLF